MCGSYPTWSTPFCLAFVFIRDHAKSGTSLECFEAWHTLSMGEAGPFTPTIEVLYIVLTRKQKVRVPHPQEVT